MKINYDKLVDLTNVEIHEDTKIVDEIIEYEEILFEISKRIKKYRTDNALTQKELAKMLSIDQVMVSKLESGNYNPTFKQIYKISRKLTESSELFLDVLKNIISNLNDMHMEKYNVNHFKEYNFNLKSNNSILFYNNYVSEKGEQYETKFSPSIISIA